MRENNILSYFIKDIKDPIELAKYRQYNTSNFIQIYYNDNIIYIHNRLYFFIYNLINNITKSNNLACICNNIIYFEKNSHFKKLFYNKDNKIFNHYANFISYIYNKDSYLYKPYLFYRINNITILSTTIKYYNGSKYIYFNVIHKAYKIKYKSLILILNKYELHYISRFFNIYFAQLFIVNIDIYTKHIFYYNVLFIRRMIQIYVL